MAKFNEWLGRVEDALTRTGGVFTPFLNARGVESIITTTEQERVDLLADKFRDAKEILAAVDLEDADTTIQAAVLAGILPKVPLYIVVATTPAGPAPDELRQQWVGTVLPAVALGNTDGDKNFLTGQSMPTRVAYAVPTQLAIDTLRVRSAEAADWFAANVPVDKFPTLTFGITEVLTFPQSDT